MATAVLDYFSRRAVMKKVKDKFTIQARRGNMCNACVVGH